MLELRQPRSEVVHIAFDAGDPVLACASGEEVLRLILIQAIMDDMDAVSITIAGEPEAVTMYFSRHTNGECRRYEMTGPPLVAIPGMCSLLLTYARFDKYRPLTGTMLVRFQERILNMRVRILDFQKLELNWMDEGLLNQISI